MATNPGCVRIFDEVTPPILSPQSFQLCLFGRNPEFNSIQTFHLILRVFLCKLSVGSEQKLGLDGGGGHKCSDTASFLHKLFYRVYVWIAVGSKNAWTGR